MADHDTDVQALREFIVEHCDGQTVSDAVRYAYNAGLPSMALETTQRWREAITGLLYEGTQIRLTSDRRIERLRPQGGHPLQAASPQPALTAPSVQAGEQG